MFIWLERLRSLLRSAVLTGKEERMALRQREPSTKRVISKRPPKLVLQNGEYKIVTGRKKPNGRSRSPQYRRSTKRS